MRASDARGEVEVSIRWEAERASMACIRKSYC